jgi:hypothetical protein
MATYSANTPPPFQADKLEDLNSVLQALPDNTSKLISPKDVRDATFTLWENTIYKVTNAGGPEYIGIDQDFITNKVYFGKKKVGGSFVMNNSLLATDTDYFFYNTKPSTSTDYDLKIAFLAGTGSNIVSGNLAAPYVKTTVTVNKDLDFEVVNPSYYVSGSSSQGGNIVLQSDYGHLILNGVRWPLASSNTASQIDHVLKYKWVGGIPYAVWEAAATSSITSLISSGPVVIQGNPVTVNGNPLEFIDTEPTPQDFGGIPAGTTFPAPGEALVEVIRRMLYPYIRPRLSSILNQSLIEFGDSLTLGNLDMTWTLIKNSTYSISTFATPASGYNLPSPSYFLPSLPSSVNGLTSGSLRLITLPNLGNYYHSFPNVSWIQETFTLSVNDTFPSFATTSNTVQYVIPWFYGTSDIGATQNTFGNTINSILNASTITNSLTGALTTGKLNALLRRPATASVTSNNQIVRLSTQNLPQDQGYVYFGYPSEFPDLVDIVDQGSFSVIGSFNKFTVSNVSSATIPARWTSKEYKFYIYVGPSSSTPQKTQIRTSFPYYGDFEFRFV